VITYCEFPTNGSDISGWDSVYQAPDCHLSLWKSSPLLT
jgi:hypothetical protein